MLLYYFIPKCKDTLSLLVILHPFVNRSGTHHQKGRGGGCLPLPLFSQQTVFFSNVIKRFWSKKKNSIKINQRTTIFMFIWMFPLFLFLLIKIFRMSSFFQSQCDVPSVRDEIVCLTLFLIKKNNSTIIFYLYVKDKNCY